jgi:hypothetical protein
MTASLAFVTVGYGPDRDRCALLSRSVEEFAPSVEQAGIRPVDYAEVLERRRSAPPE